MSNAMGVLIAGVLVAGASGSVAGAQSAPRAESKTVQRPAAAKTLPGMARIPAGCFEMGDAFKEGVYGRAEGSACRGQGGLPNDTHEVGSHAANGYGLHDLAGNVWEWVNDGYSESYYGESPVNDPPGPEPDYPVVRGGAWSAPANYLRVAYRGNTSPTLQDDLIGFRCAR